MPKLTESWDETLPAGTRSKLLGDDDIRQFKRQFRERFAEDHISLQNETDDSLVGFHKKTTLVNQGSDPLAVTDALILFAKDASSVSEMHSLHETSGINQLTRLGKLWIQSLGVASEVRGDLIVRGTSVWQRLAIGASGLFLKSDGTDLAYAAVAFQAAASQAEMEAASLNTVVVTPSVWHHNPLAPKFWCRFDGTTAGTNAPLSGSNVTSVTRNGAGDYTINFTTAFTDANGAVIGTSGTPSTAENSMVNQHSFSTTSCRILVTSAGVAVDRAIVCAFGFGDQ